MGLLPSERRHFICPQVRATQKEPRKTKDEMEGRLRSFPKTLAPCQAKRGSLEVNGEGLRPVTDIQR